MRSIVLCIFLLFPLVTLAESVKCYENGKVIYSGKVRKLIHDDTIFGFQDIKTKRYILISCTCMATL